MPLGNRARRCIALWLLLQLTAALAAAPPPLAIPNIPFALPGSVLAIAQQADGSFIIGGDLTLIDGVPRAHLARLTPAGTLDANWNPSADGIVRALATDAYGNVFAGGDFAVVGGQPHRLVAKIEGSGQGVVDDAWGPGFVDDGTSLNFDVLTLALDASGAVFAGGDFHEVGGQHRDFVAKLSGLGEGAVQRPSTHRFLAAGSNGRAVHRKVAWSVRCSQTCSCTMPLIVGWHSICVACAFAATPMMVSCVARV